MYIRSVWRIQAIPRQEISSYLTLWKISAAIKTVLQMAGKCDWHGTLESFGLNHLKELGIDPKVYLSNVPNLNLEGAYTANQAGEIHLESDPNWKLIDDFIDDFGDVSKATAFAIDLSTRTDGDLFELGENRSFSFTVTMRSPQTVDDIKKLSLETI